MMSKTPQSPAVQTVAPLENPEEAPGGGSALTIVPTSEWEKYWQKIGGDIHIIKSRLAKQREGSVTISLTAVYMLLQCLDKN